MLHCLQSNPAVGYRLAWNFMKAVRYVDSIDVATEVLKNFPDYPKIYDDIIAKAISKIRGESERDAKQKLGLSAEQDASATMSIAAA